MGDDLFSLGGAQSIRVAMGTTLLPASLPVFQGLTCRALACIQAVAIEHHLWALGILLWWCLLSPRPRRSQNLGCLSQRYVPPAVGRFPQFPCRRTFLDETCNSARREKAMQQRINRAASKESVNVGHVIEFGRAVGHGNTCVDRSDEPRHARDDTDQPLDTAISM